MSHFFDGMATLLTDVLGGNVEYIPKGQGPRMVPSVFRRQPTEGEGSDGHAVLIMAPTWRVRRDLAPDVRRGDLVRPGDGKTYEVMNTQPTGSPASDAFIVCELYEVGT